ncbi:MAG TPA: type II toxin-antitoxin system VapC family toxin [Actinomycetota bacterium]|nr:type II toxin-antitoxin system VapC family toxin [Actinomycetota bacterium]
MTFFVDANVVLYAATEGPLRDRCQRVLEAVAAGADGRTSAAVLEEVWYVERSGRAGRLDGLARAAYTIFSPLLDVTDEAFRIALDLRAPHLGPADRVHAGTCLAHGIGAILTADAAFDGIKGLRRVDPADARALGRLLSR